MVPGWSHNNFLLIGTHWLWWLQILPHHKYIQESRKDEEGKGILLTFYFFFFFKPGRKIFLGSYQANSPLCLTAESGSHCKLPASREAGKINNWLCSCRETSTGKEGTGSGFWVNNQIVCYIIDWGKRLTKLKNICLRDL